MGPRSLFHTSLFGLNHNTMKYATKRLLALSSFTSLVLLLALLPLPSSGNVLKKTKSILCADDRCQALYAKGHTVIKYQAPEEGVLSFKKDAPVLIFGRTEDQKHLYVEINKSRGLVSSLHIREDSIVNPKLDFQVDLTTESNQSQNQPNSSVDPPADSAAAETPGLSGTPASPINDQPDHQFVYSSKSATVIEGTTFYDDILKTATPSPTFPAEAVTKTSTIVANFAEPQLDKESSAALVKNDSAEEVPSSENAEKGKILGLLKPSLEPNNNTESEVAPSQPAEETEQLNAIDTQANVVEDGADDQSHLNSPPDVQAEGIPPQPDPNSIADAKIVSPEANVEIQEPSLPPESPPHEQEQQPEHIEPVAESEQLNVNVDTQAIEAKEDGNDSHLNPQPDVANVQAESAAQSDSDNTPPLSNILNANTNPPEAPQQQQPDPNPVSSHPASDTQVDPPEQISNQSEDKEHHFVENNNSQNPVPATPTQEDAISNADQKLEVNLISESNLNQPNSPVEPPSDSAITEAPVLAETPASPIDNHPVESEQVNVIDTRSNVVNEPSHVNPPPDVSSPNVHAEITPQPHSNNSPPPVSPLSNSFNADAKIIPIEANQPPPQQQKPDAAAHIQPVAQQEQLNVPSYLNRQPGVPSPNVHSESTPPVPSINHPPPLRRSFNVDAKIIPPEANVWQHPSVPPASPAPPPPPQQQQQQPDPASHVQPASNSVNPSPPHSAPSYPASDTLVDPEKYAAMENSSNSSRRKLLADKVAFVGVIMDIIPDEVELFFESFNVSMHAIVLTSIIAFFWGFVKVFTSFVGSRMKQRQLREIICQIQRKAFYGDAVTEKMREELIQMKERLMARDREFRDADNKRSRLKEDNDALKNEKNQLTKQLAALHAQATESSQSSLELTRVVDDLKSIELEKAELESLNAQLEQQVVLLKEDKRTMELTVDTLNAKIRNLDEKAEEMTAENEGLNERLTELEQTAAIQNTNIQKLQSEKIELNEQLRNLKDELLSLEAKSKDLAESNATQTSELEIARKTISSLSDELAQKKTDIETMSALLSKLNKDINNKERRRLSQLSSDLNGDITDAVNGESSLAETGTAESAKVEAVVPTKSADDEEGDLQDKLELQLRLTKLENLKEKLEKKIESLELQLEATLTELEGVKASNVSLKEETENAAQERLKAVMELEVLSKYYKEKELEYGKEIGVQRVKREQKEEDATSLAARLSSLEEENETLNKILKSTKKELEETERRYKSQLNLLEKQSHENWIAARNAERKYEESKAEATALRQTLTLSVKSPPPADLSFSGFLDDSASSISSLPDGVLNTSIHPPPPPPPPPLMMMNSLIPPPPMPGQSSMFSDMNDSSFWNPSSGPSSLNLQPASSAPNASLTNAIQSNSSDTSMVFVQSGQVPSYAQPTSHNQQPPSQVPSASNQHYQAHYSGQPQQQHHNAYQQWEDISRNTYSPALSQRSATATPHTAHLPMPMGPTAVATSQAYGHHPQQAMSQQYQQQAQQHYGSETSSAGGGANPYSISNYPSQYGQQASSSAYQQPQQQSVDAASAYGSTAPATLTASQQNHQIWTAGQPHINDPNNVYTGYPSHNASNAYPGTVPQANESGNSRPASVHTQMV